MTELLHPFECVLLEHGLDRKSLRLDDARPGRIRFGHGLGLLAGDAAGPGSLRPDPAARFLSRIHRLALDPIDDDVQARLVRGPCGVTAQDLTVDGEGNLGDLGIGGAAVLLA